MQQQQASQDGLYRAFFAAGNSSVDSILQTLEDQQSLLTGMFKEYVKEAQLAGSKAGPSGTAGCGGSPTAALQHTQAHHTAQHYNPQHVPEQHGVKRSRATELPLNVTLEELYSGTIKRVPVQLRRQDARTGAPVTVMQQLQVCVQPGLHTGTRITLPGFGNLDAQGQQCDLTFIVQQQLHPAFRRLADDLYAIVNVPLVTALTGGPVELKTLNGQLLQLPVAENSIITPNSELVLKNQGMPVFGDASGKRGALHVRFRVCFPSQLSTHQQQMLRQALSDADDQPLCAAGDAAAAVAAVATAAGLLPKPQVSLPLLPASPPAGAHEQERQQQHRRVQDRHGFAWVAARSSWQQAATAAVGVSGSPGSSTSAWTAAVAFGGGVQGGVSAFAQAAGAAACSAASSSSSAGPPACMQSTGSSKQLLGGVSQRPLSS